MKKALKIIVYLVLALVIIIGGTLMYFNIKGIPSYKPGNISLKVEVTPKRVERGRKLATVLCADCHMSMEAQTLTGRELKEVDQFGKLYSANITQDTTYGIGKWTDGELVYFLRTGIKRDGSYAPVWMPKLTTASDEDVKSIIAFLHSDDAWVKANNTPDAPCEPNLLAKILANLAFPATKFPYPSAPIPDPDTNNHLALGKYIMTTEGDCFACHSKDFKSNDYFTPEKSVGYLAGGNTLKDLDGKEIHSANITMDKETGIGTWTRDQFIKAVRYGKRPDGKNLRYPMIPRPILDSAEVVAIWDYLQTVPPTKNVVDRN